MPQTTSFEADVIDIIAIDFDAGINAEIVYGIKAGSGSPPGWLLVSSTLCLTS